MAGQMFEEVKQIEFKKRLAKTLPSWVSELPPHPALIQTLANECIPGPLLFYDAAKPCPHTGSLDACHMLHSSTILPNCWTLHQDHRDNFIQLRLDGLVYQWLRSKEPTCSFSWWSGSPLYFHQILYFRIPYWLQASVFSSEGYRTMQDRMRIQIATRHRRRKHWHQVHYCLSCFYICVCVCIDVRESWLHNNYKR